MVENRLRALLDADRPTLGTRIQSRRPGIVEALGQTEKQGAVDTLDEIVAPRARPEGGVRP